VSLNPQPLPPTPSDWLAGPRPHPWSPDDAVALNPQPLPPLPAMGELMACGGSAKDEFIWFESGDDGTGSVRGETSDTHWRPKSAFELKDFSFGVENPTTIGSATGGAGSGKAEFGEFTITKPTHAYFFKNCVGGAHYKNVVLPTHQAGHRILPGTLAPCTWCAK